VAIVVLVAMSRRFVLARSSRLRHPAGIPIETPLLVPSFSSKGFGMVSQDQPGEGEVLVSEAKRIFEVASEFLFESMLLSAYDLYHDHIPQPIHAITETTIVDSGGYETSVLQDLSATFVQVAGTKEWDENKHREVLDAWPDHIPAMFVSYDDAALRLPLQSQIENARSMSGRYRSQMATFLVKPDTSETNYVSVPQIVAHAEELDSFDVIGLTEKELGRSFMERMVHIAQIRRALNQAELDIPIHIFGSLDPISVSLYFLVGAEIFDGLSWLRYGYYQGSAVYRHNFAVNTIGIHRTDDFIKMKTVQDNLSYLANLANDMRRFLNDNDFSVFGSNEHMLREAFDLVRTRIEEVA
jgi:hypothetical protein